MHLNIHGIRCSSTGGYDKDGYPIYSEIGIFAGIHATDWSWAALIADLDNDGWKDIFISNGIPGRPNDLDYLAYTSDAEVQRSLHTGSFDDQMAVAQRMPSLRIPNYGFKNERSLQFEDVTASWGLDEPSYSNGAAYGDLDADGDIDLVINDIDGPARIYRNNSTTHYHLSVSLRGLGGNTAGIGAKVHIYADGMHLYQEQMPTRGFQSSVDHTLHFGLGMLPAVDSITVIWPTGTRQTLHEPVINTVVHIAETTTQQTVQADTSTQSSWFVDTTAESGLDYRHKENQYNDFTSQPLLPYRLSTQGPAVAVGDVNGDSLDDIFLGGAHNTPGTLFMQVSPGRFSRTSSATFEADAMHEDVDAVFFDADMDGDQDLYVVSGGGEFAEGTAALEDRLYFNSEGSFERSAQLLPRSDGCCVSAADYDSDGDLDLFVGTRSVPARYGHMSPSFLLSNDGNGILADVSADSAPSLQNLGMVTSSTWADVTGSPEPDLVIVGEWMPITVLSGSGSHLDPVPLGLGPAPAAGGKPFLQEI